MKKKILLFSLVIFLTFSAHAQWTDPNGDNTGPIHYDKGNVGIGTPSPKGRLHVTNGTTSGLAHGMADAIIEDANHAMMLLLSGNSSIGYFGFADSDDTYVGGMQYDHSTNQLTFRVNDHLSDVVINSSGNVGIGTTIPLTALHVSGAGSGGVANSTTPNQGLLIGADGTGGVLNMGIISNNGFYSWLQSRHKSSATWYNLALNPAGGNVGIGTTSPKGRLHVTSGVTNGVVHGMADAVIEDADHAMMLLLSNNNSTSYFGFADSDDTYVGGMQYDHSNNQLAFRVNDHASDVVISSAGNVGIGTTETHGYKLAVAGKMITEEVVVKLRANWPDYVFEAEYPLTPLEDLEIYLKENKHLPGIPDAKTVGEEGIILGEMNAKLLEKVEELTLYMIQLKKENDDLLERIKKLEDGK